jgi:hypothetical protein
MAAIVADKTHADAPESVSPIPDLCTNPAGCSLTARAGTGRTHICIVIAGDS